MGSEGVGWTEIHHSDCHFSQSAVSRALLCTQALPRVSKIKIGPGKHSSSAKPTVAGRGAFLELGISTAQHFLQTPHSSTWHVKQKLGDIVETAEFFSFFSPLPF